MPEFERVARELKLKPNQYLDSQRLRKWAKLNRHSKYVPEWLLEAWHFDDAVMLSDDTNTSENASTLWPLL